MRRSCQPCESFWKVEVNMGCWTHGVECIEVGGVLYCPECYPTPPTNWWLSKPETVPEMPAAEPSLALIDASEPNDTDRPLPELPPPPPNRCYWCHERANVVVYNGIPSCDSCKRRAVGRRRDR